MNIWIIEDDDTYARTAALAAVRAAKATEGISMRSVRIYRNASIQWGGDLITILLTQEDDLSIAGPRFEGRLRQIAPRVVVLDLFDGQLRFKARDFLLALRKWEFDHDLPPASVILWSGWSGLPDARDFVVDEPRRDWRVVWLETKDDTLLRLAIQGYIRTEIELQNA